MTMYRVIIFWGQKQHNKSMVLLDNQLTDACCGIFMATTEPCTPDTEGNGSTTYLNMKMKRMRREKKVATLSIVLSMMSSW